MYIDTCLQQLGILFNEDCFDCLKVYKSPIDFHRKCAQIEVPQLRTGLMCTSMHISLLPLVFWLFAHIPILSYDLFNLTFENGQNQVPYS